jgi:hypothetical protein
MIVRRVLGLLGCAAPPSADAVEIAVLRHQLAVLRRQVPRPRYTPADRMLLAALAKLLPRERWAAFLVTPSTLLCWHRELIARRWTYPHTGRDRRELDEEVVALVVRLARENPRWGYLRIVGECRNLGVRVSACGVPVRRSAVLGGRVACRFGSGWWTAATVARTPGPIRGPWLAPFAMRRAFPASDYRSLRPAPRSSADGGPAPYHPGWAVGRATTKRFPCSPRPDRRGRRPALPLQPRRKYAAGNSSRPPHRSTSTASESPHRPLVRRALSPGPYPPDLSRFHP